MLELKQMKSVTVFFSICKITKKKIFSHTVDAKIGCEQKENCIVGRPQSVETGLMLPLFHLPWHLVLK
jgi:hypothetical protein